MKYLNLYEVWNAGIFVYTHKDDLLEILNDLRDMCLELRDEGYLVTLRKGLYYTNVSIFDSNETIIGFMNGYGGYKDQHLQIRIHSTKTIDGVTVSLRNREGYPIFLEIVERIIDYMNIHRINTKVDKYGYEYLIDFYNLKL